MEKRGRLSEIEREDKISGVKKERKMLRKRMKIKVRIVKG
jgi:hypothetical protein